MLPWFQNQFPIYLAPMAGVTDVTFRTLCKEMGADVMVTEFVSAEGILQADHRTRRYTTFTDEQRPLGIQLFGANGERMGEAAKRIIDWKRPDFIDLNFGCPVNKVVSKNGGSSLLRDCPLLADTARKIVKAIGHEVPVTGKIRIGWDDQSINGPEVCQILEDCGIQAVGVHGRTRAQSYRGEADWEVIDTCARAVSIPVIGNGDIDSVETVQKRRKQTAVSGLMIGRAAMQNPWLFREIKAYLTSGELPPRPSIRERWSFVLRHCQLAVESDRYGDEKHTLQAMRSRLMTYCKGFPGAKPLRQELSQVLSVADVQAIADRTMARVEAAGLEEREAAS